MAAGRSVERERARVLVAEDEYFVADDIAQKLADLGVLVVGPALDAEMALTLAKSGELDGAVLDVNLHGKMAYPVADLLRARDIPFVLATGYAPEALPERFRSVPQWEKPYDVSEVTKGIVALIDRKRALQGS